jgi:cell division protein FtsZ
MPFSFEGKRRLKQAEDALDQLQKRADALILFENNRMGELILPKDGIQKAFTQADQLIAQSLRAVSTILTTPGLVKLGLDDLTAALNTSNGRCLFGFGEARGQNRGSEAVKRALKSPLIDQGRLLHQTRTLLVHIAGGESLTLLEVDAIMKQLGKNVPDQTHILFGVAVDAKLGDSVCVTLLSSLGLAQLNTLAAAAPPADMLPLHDRPMPSVVEALPKPPPEPVSEQPKAAPPQAQPTSDSPRRATTAKTVSSPSLDQTAPPPAPQVEIPPPPVSRPAPAKARPVPPAAVKAMDLLFPEEDVAPPSSALPELALQTATQDDDLFQQAAATLDKASQVLSRPKPAEQEPETRPMIPSEVTSEDQPEPENPQAVQEAPLPPAKPPRPSIEDFIPIKPSVQPSSTTGLASVVAARPIQPAQPVSHEASVSAIRPAAPSVVIGKSNGAAANGEQTAFRFGSEEDRGRFQKTEPVLADGGEDLDVPTWMRLKRKLKR